MKLPGYCTGCRRIRQVTVGTTAFMLTDGVPSGLCDDCAENGRWRGLTVTLRNRSTREAVIVRLDSATTHSFVGLVHGEGRRTYQRPLWEPLR